MQGRIKWARSSNNCAIVITITTEKASLFPRLSLLGNMSHINQEWNKIYVTPKDPGAGTNVPVETDQVDDDDVSWRSATDYADNFAPCALLLCHLKSNILLHILSLIL